MNNVFLYKCPDYNKCKDAIEKLVNDFEVLKNIKCGTKVLIKANLISALPPEKAATTNYILLSFLVDYLNGKGAIVTVGDSPGGLFTKAHLESVYKITKYNEIKANLNYDLTTKKVNFDNAKVLKNFEYTSYLDGYDIKINFCKLKTHAMMKMSANVKNLFGTIPGLTKTEYHYRFPNHNDFANMLIDLNEFFKFDINITDAICGMDGNGPTMGDPKKIGLILASENPYALDYICAKIINLDPMVVPTVKESYNRNLFDIKKIYLNDDINKYIVKDFNNIGNISDIKFYNHSIFGGVVKKIFDNKPYCKKSKCIGCGKCATMCPQKAIKMINKKPVIDRKKCIKCYCCQEFCPVGAMQIKSSMINKYRHGGKK